MGNDIGILVVGAGRAGMVHARNVRSEVPGAYLAGVVDSDPEAAERARRELGLKRALSDLDEALEDPTVKGVVITTPTFTHEALAVAAAKAGKHVLCEKPMALDAAEAERMIHAARQAKVVLQLGFMRRFDPAFLAAKQQLDEGAIGEMMMIRSLTRGPGLPPAWANDPERGGGMLAEVNSHDFDAVRWLSGSDYARIYAEAAALKAKEAAAQFPGFYDNAIVSAKLQRGALATIDGACPVDYGYDARVEILGSEGVLFVGELRSEAVAICTKAQGVVQRAFPSWRDRFREAYRAEMCHFVACIRGEHPPVVTGEDGLAALRAVLAARESLRSGRPVELGKAEEA
jgi:myo-inositol 2-dehydrogenase/D-chiro-inositol 1-dehydrogenase/scyllo-inositol 2-dehydrogenase (NAD+)